MPTTPRRLTPLRADALMLCAAFIWGMGFIAQKLGAVHLGPLSFTGFRFLLAAIILVPFVLGARFSRPELQGGLICGGVLGVGAVLQQWGMGATTAGNGGFITTTYVIIAPFIAMLLGQRVHWPVWAGVALVLPGLWFLSIQADATIQPGDPFVLASAFAWAIHIILIGRWADRVHVLRYTFIQFAVTGLIASSLALGVEKPTLGQIGPAVPALVFAAVFPTVLAFALQAIAQRVAPPAHSSVLLSLEAVFAMLAGVFFLGERAGPRVLIGAALMLAGTLVAQWRITASAANRNDGRSDRSAQHAASD